MGRYFIRLANVRELPRVLAFCVLVLGLPSLAIGMHADDYVIAQRVLDHPFDAFMFFPGGSGTAALRESGMLNWSVSQGLKLHLWRPLASLSHALDFAVWPGAAWFMHLENVLLYAAVIWAATLLYRELLGSGLCAGLAALWYALNPSHGTSVGWISSRNTLLSMLLGMLTLLLFVRAPRGRMLARAAPLIMHALALLAGEAALAILAPLVAHALFLDAGARRRVLPHLVLCGVYLFGYAKFGYGAAHSGMYLNALQQPWAFTQNLVMAVPLYIASQLVAPYASLAGLLSSGTWLLVAFSCLILVVLAPWFLPYLRTDARARFFALSSLGSIVPLAAMTPQDRLGYWVGFGVCGLLGLCLSADEQALFRRGIPRALFQLRTIGALLGFVPLCFVCCSALVGGAPRALNAALVAPAERDVVVLNVPAETTLMSITATRRYDEQTALRSIRALYVGGAPYEVTRVDARTIDVYVARAWFSNVIERLAREPRDEPFAPGDVETTDLLSARILQVDARGAPLRVRFEFMRPLDDPRWLWLRFEGERALPWTPPAIGAVQQLGPGGLLL